MRPEDVVAAGQIGDGAGDAQDAVHGTRRKLQQVDGVLEHRLVIGCESADRIRLRLVEVGVEPARAPQLCIAGAHDARADDVAGFAGRRVGSQFGGRQARDFQMQVDAFQQRPGDLAAVSLDRFGMAAAAARGIARPAARTGIHRGHQLEARREFALPRRARDGDDAGLQRFAQDFQRAAIPFGQFVEKEDAVVRQRDLARPRLCAAADDRFQRI